MTNIYKTIHDIGIIPIVTLEKVEDALEVAKALNNGGLPIAEVTYRTDVASEVIKKMLETYPNMLLGAGTIQTKEQVDSAIAAGAKFIVTPSINEEIVKYCKSKDVTIIPGISSTSELETAISLGLEVVKFFPAESLGGINTLKALHGPYKNIKFIPMGGLNESNINNYLKESFILACGGSWMIDKDLSKIEELTKSAVKEMLNITLSHVGINEENDDGALIAEKYGKLFDGKVRQTSKGWFGSNYVEIMSNKLAMGKYGHIGMGTNNIDRAKRYYESLGYEFDESTAAYDNEGNLKVIYFKDEVGGFRFHLVKN